MYPCLACLSRGLWLVYRVKQQDMWLLRSQCVLASITRTGLGAHVEDLNKAHAHSELCILSGCYALEDVLHDLWDDSLLRGARHERGAAHGVGLAGTCLAVGKAAGIVALEQPVHQGLNALLIKEHRWLGSPSIHLVVREGRAVLASHLRLSKLYPKVGRMPGVTDNARLSFNDR